MTLSFAMIWPLALAVFADVFYQIAAKSTPAAVDPFASLTITYLVAAVTCFVLYYVFNHGKADIVQQWHHANWTAFVLGIAVVGLEVALLFMYKAGWPVSSAVVVKAGFLAIALLFVGLLLYKEPITGSKVAGVFLCLGGLYLLNR